MGIESWFRETGLERREIDSLKLQELSGALARQIDILVQAEKEAKRKGDTQAEDDARAKIRELEQQKEEFDRKLIQSDEDVEKAA